MKTQVTKRTLPGTASSQNKRPISPRTSPRVTWKGKTSGGPATRVISRPVRG